MYIMCMCMFTDNAWYVVNGIWYMVYVWPMVYGISYIVYIYIHLYM